VPSSRSFSLSYYSDWRRFSGVLTLHTFIERERGSGRTMNTLHWELIELNPVLIPGELEVPSVTH